MKKVLIFLFLQVPFLGLWADDEALQIVHDGIVDYAALSEIDSIYTDPLGQTLYVQPLAATEPVSLPRASVSSISFLPAAECPTSVLVLFDGEQASVRNPFFLSGVTATVDSAYVTIDNTNTTTELTTRLSGVSSNGGFLYNGVYKTTIVLDSLTLTSKRGASIDIECGKRVELHLKKGTVNTLVDAANGDQKAALYCKGHLEIDKPGTLNVTGKTGHAIAAKEYIKLKKSDGTINILGAVKDGIHCKQYYVGNGFTVNIQKVGDDGIQSELDGAANEDDIVDGTLIINGGTYTIKNTTNGSTSNGDTDTAKGLNADGNMQLNGGTISITMSGTGGKGIRVEGTYTQGIEGGEGPTLKVGTTGATYTTSSSSSTGGGGWGGWPGGGGGWGGNSSSGSSAKAIKVKGQATIYGGTSVITTTQSGAEGLESKTRINIAGGNHYFKCYDDCINSSGIVEFSGGTTVCYSNGNDAVDSNYGKKGAITISGGNIFAYTTKGSPEEGLDCDNNSYIVVTGGIGISAGGNQGGGGGGWGGSSSTTQSIGSSTQGYYLGSSPSSYSTGKYYTLLNTSGEAICTYKFEGSCSNALSLLTAPNLGKGSVKVMNGTAKPTGYTTSVANASGTEVFFIAPTVTASSTTATVTAK